MKKSEQEKTIKGAKSFEISAEELMKRIFEPEEESKRKKIREEVFNWILAFSIPLIISVVAFTVSPNEKSRLIQKNKIQNEISTAILNGANLQVVKQIYKNRKFEENKFKNLFKSIDEYYKSDIVLSEILSDIHASIFLKDSVCKKLIAPLVNIINEHSQIYPFDKLDNTQRDLFENIRLKIPNEYEKIQNDLIKVSDELYNRDLLVTQYLNKSNTSFWISITALVLSLMIGIFQIYQNRSSRFKKLLNSISLSEPIDINEENQIETGDNSE